MANRSNAFRLTDRRRASRNIGQARPDRLRKSVYQVRQGLVLGLRLWMQVRHLKQQLCRHLLWSSLPIPIDQRRQYLRRKRRQYLRMNDGLNRFVLIFRLTYNTPWIKFGSRRFQTTCRSKKRIYVYKYGYGWRGIFSGFFRGLDYLPAVGRFIFSQTAQPAR